MSQTVSAAGMLALTALTASAQNTSPDPSLSQVFTTINGNVVGVSTNASLGIGFDSNNFNGLFPASLTNATAQSYINGFVLHQGTDNTAAQADLSQLTAGSSFQVGVNTFAFNRQGSGPVSIGVAIYQYGGSTATPITGSALFSSTLVIPNGDVNAPTGALNYTAKGTLAQSIVDGQRYEIVFSAPSGLLQWRRCCQFRHWYSWFLRVRPGRMPPRRVRAIFKSEIRNRTDNPLGGPFTAGSGSVANPVVYSFYAASSAPVPEASTVVSLLTLTGMMGACVKLRRRA